MAKGKESKKHDAPSCGRGRGGDVAGADAVADLLRDEGVHGVDVDDDLGFHENPLETAAEGDSVKTAAWTMRGEGGD